jgi:hypothetical protein
VHTVKETPDVSLTRFDHPAGANLSDSEEQAADRFQINIVERGAFRLGHEGREWLLGSSSIFLSRPDDVYQYAHLLDIEADTCLSVNLSRTLSNEFGEHLRCLPLVPAITNRLRFLQLQLASIVRDDIGLRLETLACELVEAVSEAPTNKRRLYRPNQLKWYADRIHVARDRMDANPLSFTLVVASSDEPIPFCPCVSGTYRFTTPQVFASATPCTCPYSARIRHERHRYLLRRRFQQPEPFHWHVS